MQTFTVILLLIIIVIATNIVSNNDKSFISRCQAGFTLLFTFPAIISAVLDMNNEPTKRMGFYRSSYVKTHVVVTRRGFDKKKGGYYFHFTEDGNTLPVFYSGDVNPKWKVSDTLLINNIGKLSKMTTGEYDIKTGKWILD